MGSDPEGNGQMWKGAGCDVSRLMSLEGQVAWRDDMKVGEGVD